MATLEEGEVVVTPDVKNETISTDKMDTLEKDKLVVPPDFKNERLSTENSNTLSNSNIENSESQPINNVSNLEAQANKGLSASEIQATGGGANELDNAEESLKHELENSEPEPNHQLANVKDPDNNSEATLDDPVVNSEAQPDNQLVNCEAIVGKKPGPKLPPSKQVVNSEALPNNGVANSEIHTSNNVEISVTEGSNGVLVSETQCSNQVVTSEVLPNNDVVNSEIQTSNNGAISETKGSNGVVVSETQCNEVVISETQYSNGVVVSETQHINEVVISETQHINEVVVSENRIEIIECETQHADEMVVYETQPSDKEVIVSETQPNNEAIVCETQHGNEVVVPETRHSDEVVWSEIQTDNEAIMSESQPSCEVVMSDTQPRNETVMHERYPNDVVVCDTQPSSEVVMSDTQPSNETVMHERYPNDVVVCDTQPSSDIAMSDTQPVMHEIEIQINSDVIVSGTQHSNEVIMHEALIRNDVIVSEALFEHELADSTLDLNNQLSHSETLHEFTDLHMIPEDQLPQPEPLPDSESPPRSEPLADSNLADIKPVPYNHLHEYDMLPNNHLDHSEALANYQLAHAETFPHDQLASSQMMSHYELVNSQTLDNNQLITSQGHYEIVSAHTIPSYEIVNAETLLDDEDHTPETQPNKRRKKKSVVWQHFTIETVSAGCRRAYCNECKQSFAYSTGSKVAGTSHLKRHIAKGACPALLRNQDQNQLTPHIFEITGGGASVNSAPKRRYRSPSTPYIIFDQDRCRHEIAKMVIRHDYPLHMVEHPGFVAFVQHLQPQFNMGCFLSVQGECVTVFLRGRSFLAKYIRGLPGRVTLTLDIWSSSQSMGYVFITGHFADSDWKLQRRVLNVLMERYPDSDTAISHAVADCIKFWDLKGRLFSITCNRTLTEDVLENLRSLLSVKNPLILNGQLPIRNCIARTLSNVANDSLSLAQDTVSKIRDSVKYVQTSVLHEEQFLELKQQLQVPSERRLFIDDQTKWNTTYQMLVAASELKEVFSCLDTFDPDYKGAPSVQDWKLVETLCTYLKPLFDAANILITTTNPTIIACFHEVWKMQLDLARAPMNEDPFISKLAKPMQERIGKYWRDCRLILATAVVMDPRFKMKLVEFSFTKLYGKDAHVHVKIVSDGICELFQEYVNFPLPLTLAYAEGDAGSHMGETSGGTASTDNGLTDFDAYIMETNSQQMKSELDQYLEESLLPRVPDFDVLGWWKINKLKYPTLSKMARDILSISVSTVPSDSFFDRKCKEMDQYRCSLEPEVVQALVCANDWMQYIGAEMDM